MTSEYPELTPDAILELRNPSELPHHWFLRKQFLTVQNGKYPQDRLICLSHIFVNVECLGLTYPDEIMLTAKALGTGIDKSCIEMVHQDMGAPQQSHHQPTSRYFNSHYSSNQRSGRPYHQRRQDNQRRYR